MNGFKQIRRRWRRRIFECFGNPKYSRPAANDLDAKLAKYLDFRGGTFVEAGANNGYSQSNTYYLEKILGWRGLLVEPIPALFEQCRRERKGARVCPCALVADDYPEPTIVIHFAGLMSAVEGSRKGTEDLAQRIREGLRVQKLSQTYTLRVPARTLASLLEEHGFPGGVDFLSLDVEGYEIQVLQGLNLAKHAPRHLLVETQDPDAIDRALGPDYARVEQMSWHDFFYRRRDEPGRKAG